jgi:SAM-dependent methyltransferase
VTNIDSWDRIAARASALPPTDVVNYGPDGPGEDELRLLGDVRGKRVLDLGCGSGQAAVTLARQGATVIAVDASGRQLERARRLAARDDVRVEWHQGDLADLAFLRADSIDLAFSAFAVAEVEDIARLFRQVHRVLRAHSTFAFSYEHPLSLCTGPERTVVRSYFDAGPVTVQRDGEPVELHLRTISGVFADLGRAGFRVEVIAEPRSSSEAAVPSALVWRARKEGV